MAPLMSVILGSILVYLTHAEKHGVQVVSNLSGSLSAHVMQPLQYIYIYIDWRSDVAWLIDIRDFFCRYYTQIGHLKKGLNPPSLSDLAFGSPYLVTAIKTGAVTGIIALAVSPHHLSNHHTLIRQLVGRESTYVMLHLPRGFLDT